MERFASIFLGLIFSTLALSAQTSAQQYVNSQASREPLKGSTWGIYAKDASGKVLASYNAGIRLMPASNRKLITTGVALHALGPDFRFRTTLGYTGVLQADGTLDGDVYIIGGGDPTIGTQDTTIALKADALFWKWKTLLREKGIQRIHGRIIGDGSSMEGLLEHPSWEYDDMGTYYGTGGNALCFYENAIDMQVSATQTGHPINLTQVYPETPWLQVSNYDIVKIASIIEKEAITDEDRPKVSSVFYNRLSQSMALQSDATMSYVTDGVVTSEDLTVDSPYNTYYYKGLPPTPICTPSGWAIEAAMYPADTDDLFFFIIEADGYSNHTFSKTYEEHESAYQAALEEQRAAASAADESGE